MADISHHQFITLLKKSNVIDAKKLQPWLDRSTKIESARKLAKSLVQQELLTTWQAKFLLSGRYRLRIGNYFLLSRLRRDELGARYLAIHATLNRKVELQIFARDLTSDTKRWKDMIQKASLVAKLDHSALVHVYDIDHDDDRYFLVVEHVPGRSLDVQTEIFTTPQIGKLILQCAEGIEFAHQNNVVHGTIDQSDIVLTEKGTVKLQNLTVSPMRKQKNDEPEAKPVADFKALAKLGKKLLDANPGADSGSGADLIKIFALMNAKGAGAMSKLRQWVEAASAADAKSAQTNSGANLIFSRTLDGSDVELSKLSKDTYEPDAPDEEAAATSSASIVAAAKASPPFLIACGIGLLVFCGIITYGISQAYSKMVAAPAARAAAEEAEQEKAEKEKAAKYKERERQQFEAWEAKQEKEAAEVAKQPGKPDKAKRPKNRRKNDDSQSPANEDKSNPADKELADGGQADSDKPKPSESMANEATPKNSPPEDKEEPNKFLDIFGDKKKKERQEAAKEKLAKGGVPAIPDGVDPDDLTKLTNIGHKTQRVLYAGGVKTYKQISEMNPAALDQVLANGKFNKMGEKWLVAIAEAKPLAEEAAEAAKEHFRKVPSVLGLPPVDSTDPKVLTKLEIPGSYVLSIELVSPKGIAQRRVFFELTEDSTENEKWTVLSKRNKKSQSGIEIATFQKADDKFVFAWKPEAAKDKTAAYLKNCLLRMSTPDGRSCVSKLRKPINSIRSLRISKESLIDELNMVIDALPHQDKIRIQLGALRNQERTIEVIKPLISFESPGVIKLKRRDKGGFMNMQISAKRSGRGIKLTAALVLRGVPIKSYKQLEAFEKQLEAVNANAQQLAEGTKKDSPERKHARVAKAGADRMIDYRKSIDWLLEGGGETGQAIDFEVVADFEDGLVVLAKSNKNLPKSSKKKKK